MKVRILLVEDDDAIAMGLKYSLEEEGLEVTIADTCKKAMDAVIMDVHDLYILDLSLPDGSGYDICKRIKERSDKPVIFLTACDDEVNVVMGLDMGAEDYVAKPFRIRELVSRIWSVLRRCGKMEKERKEIVWGDVRIRLNEARVFKKENEVALTALEYRLLLVLVQNMGRVLTRDQLFQGIWDVSGDFVNDNTLTVYVKRIREKLEDDPSKPSYIQTVRGLGYKVVERKQGGVNVEE